MSGLSFAWRQENARRRSNSTRVNIGKGTTHACGRIFSRQASSKHTRHRHVEVCIYMEQGSGGQRAVAEHPGQGFYKNGASDRQTSTVYPTAERPNHREAVTNLARCFLARGWALMESDVSPPADQPINEHSSFSHNSYPHNNMVTGTCIFTSAREVEGPDRPK